MATRKTSKPKKDYKPYFERLRDPRWQKKRLEVMQRDGFRCCQCHTTESTLNVHHRWYEKGLDPWEYTDDVYLTLCELCHEELHRDLLEFQKMLPSSKFARGGALDLMKAYHEPWKWGLDVAMHRMADALSSIIEHTRKLCEATNEEDIDSTLELLKADSRELSENAIFHMITMERKIEGLTK